MSPARNHLDRSKFLCGCINRRKDVSLLVLIE